MHRKAKLTPFGRRLLVDRVLRLGWPICRAAEWQGVSRPTAYKWVARYRVEGEAGLVDRSSRPHRSPSALPEAVVRRVLAARRDRRWGPHRLAPALKLPRSTVYALLRRHGCSRLTDFDPATRQVIRYVRERPGELIHIDIKKLGRVPEGGGHRLLGRERDLVTKHLPPRGHDFIYVAVDDCTRLAFAARYASESADLAGTFLAQASSFFARQGVRVQSVMTDNGVVFTRGRAFRATLGELALNHLLTQPYQPRTNGKAERFIQTMLSEWAYDRLYVNNDSRSIQLGRWLYFYNSRRHHTAVGSSPLAALNNLRGKYS